MDSGAARFFGGTDWWARWGVFGREGVVARDGIEPPTQ